jgi:4-hydroxymandelate oxidase
MPFAAGAPRRVDAAFGELEAADGGSGRDPGLLRVVRIAFPEPAGQVEDADYAERLDLYIRDMLREHAPDALPEGRHRAGWSYSEMATALIERCVPAQEAADLLVLAYSAPDINPGRNMAALLSERCPGSPLAFGLTDQGAAGPFTGLRLIREYARTAGLRRALLLVVEQAALPYRAGSPAAAAMPGSHTGVALLFGDAARPASAAPPVRLGPIATSAGSGEGGVEREIRALCADPADTTVILSSALVGVAEKLIGAGFGVVRAAQPGRPLAGLWWELADELDAMDGAPRRLVLCDYDPLQSCVCAAVLRVADTADQSHVLETTRNGSAPLSASAAR